MNRRSFLKGLLALAVAPNVLETIARIPVVPDEPAWSCALTSTVGGRFSGVKLRKVQDTIWRQGSGKIDLVWISPDVEADYRALLREQSFEEWLRAPS